MKRPTMLVEAILEQFRLDLDLSVERDVATLRRRCEHEGFSFLTITLPQLSDALERGIEAGTFSCPSSFARHGRLPRFLGGFFKRVFSLDGNLLPEPCPYAIAGIRQVSRFFKKPKLECSEARNRDAIRHFKATEEELRRLTPQIEREDYVLDRISSLIWSQVFPELDGLDLVCHHGPGVTADRRLSNERYRIRQWPQRSELTYPSDLHCYPNYGYAAGETGCTGEGTGSNHGLEYLDVKDEVPVRVVFVPKTLTSPRVIAIEPSYMQYMQQSLKDYMYATIEHHDLTRNSIRFTRQDPNQRLAYEASKDRRLATLDLKDASDRVHLALVRRIFKNSGLLEYLEDARSLHADLPDGSNVVLEKYASMGSALCFPVEACVFYTLIQAAMHTLSGTRPTSRSVKRFSKRIAVYGDDIIVPVEYADVVVRYLESYALKVNVNKSFKNSFFRESCGADFFKGVPVNPVYAREVPHDNSRDWTANSLMSWNATADLFYMRGQWHVAQTIRDMLASVVRRTIPRSRKPGAGLSHLSYMFDTHCRYDSALHSWKQKRIVFDPIRRKDQIDGDDLACLNKWGISSYRRERLGSEGCTSSLRLRPTWVYASAGDTPSSLDSPHLRDESPRVVARSGEQSLPDVSPVVSGESVFTGFSRYLEDTSPELGSSETESGTPMQTLRGDAFVETWAPDPLSYLTDSKEGLDFQTSTKRGGFKSKHRWVSLGG